MLASGVGKTLCAVRDEVYSLGRPLVITDAEDLVAPLYCRVLVAHASYWRLGLLIAAGRSDSRRILKSDQAKCAKIALCLAGRCGRACRWLKNAGPSKGGVQVPLS
jgi:hypothetical protein